MPTVYLKLPRGHKICPRYELRMMVFTNYTLNPYKQYRFLTVPSIVPSYQYMQTSHASRRNSPANT
ncbi:MAG: hypothetical protein WBL28_10835 [Methylotenera sp.]